MDMEIAPWISDGYNRIRQQEAAEAANNLKIALEAEKTMRRHERFSQFMICLFLVVFTVGTAAMISGWLDFFFKR